MRFYGDAPSRAFIVDDRTIVSAQVQATGPAGGVTKTVFKI